jgi:hypothetical protein
LLELANGGSRDADGGVFLAHGKTMHYLLHDCNNPLAQ